MASDLPDISFITRIANFLKPKPKKDLKSEGDHYDEADFITWLGNNYNFPQFLKNFQESIILGFFALFSFVFSLISDPILPRLLWQLLMIDFLISTILSHPNVREKSYKMTNLLPSYFKFNQTSYFTKTSILFRISRFILYYLVVLVLIRGSGDIDLLFIGISLFFLILIYIFFSQYYEISPENQLMNWFTRQNSFIKLLIVISCLGFIGVMARLYHVYSIGTWDEGWFADIAMRMAKDENWLLPLYYSDADTINPVKLFDKPPFIFWLGAIAIKTLGNTSLAVKWPMGFLSGLMGVFGFLLYHHQKSQFYHDTIPKIEGDSAKYLQQLEKTEKEEKNTDGFAIGIIFGLLMSLSWFVVFYGRTSYLDAAIVALTALTAVFGVKAIDHFFYGNTRRAFFYVILTGLINAIDLFSKAWQGLVVGPSIALYFFIRFFQHFIPKYNIKTFWKLLRPKLFKITKDLETEVGAVLGAILALLIFSSLRGDNGIKLNFDLLILSTSLDFWGIVIAIILFFIINSFLQVIFKSQEDRETKTTNEKDDKKSEIEEQGYIIPSESQKNFRISKQVLFILLGLIFGFVGAYLSNFGFDLIYSRFLDPVGSIIIGLMETETSTMPIDWGTGGIPADYRLVIGILVTGTFSLLTSLAFSTIGIWLIGIFILGIIQITKELIEKTVGKHRINDNIFYSKFDVSWAKGIIFDFSLLIPIIPLGIAIGFWGIFLFFFGEFFNRDWFLITVYGITILLVGFFVSIFILKFIKDVYRYQLKEISGYSDIEDYYLNRWTKRYKKFLIFTLILLIIIILSFTPFMWWIQHLDSSLEELGFFIRKAGELYRDPNSPGECWLQPGDPVNKCITYTWLFFEFYISWRYDFGTNYDLLGSVSAIYEPITVICFPFFLAGIYMFIKKRDFATLSLYLSWLLLVIFIFIPAKFQLNYYYLAVFFPYLAISAYGIFFSLQKVKSAIHLKDMYERTVLIVPLFVLLIISQVGPYLFNLDLLLNNPNSLRNFISTLVLIIGLFFVISLFIVRSIPGMFAAMFLTFWMHDYLWGKGWGEFDEMYLISTLILISVPLFMLRDKIPLKSLLFIGLIVSSGALGSAWWVQWKSGNGEDGFERMGSFILSHGGGMDNKSYWMYQEAGSKYSIRYYLNGADPINIRSTPEHFFTDSPFRENNAEVIEEYSRSVNFFIVLTRSVWDNVIAQADYDIAFRWLKDHYVDVGPLLGMPDWHHIRLLVNPEILTSEELSQLQIIEFNLKIDNIGLNSSFYSNKGNTNKNLTNIEPFSIVQNINPNGNWVGSGTLSDPYIIQNYQIKSTNFLPPITILRTSDYVIIRNNVLEANDLSNSGIFISDSENINIYNNTIINNGVYLERSSNIHLKDNHFLNTDIGVILRPLSSASVENNYFDNGSRGIDIQSRSDANITQNLFGNMTGDAIHSSFSDSLKISDNFFLNNSKAINIDNTKLTDPSTEITITNNSLLNNRQTGIAIDRTSSNVSIIHNTIENNGFDGIQITNSSKITINNNSINNNGMNGVWIMNSPFTNIQNNKIIGNSRTGLKFIRNQGSIISGNSLKENLDGMYLESCFIAGCIQNTTIIKENHIHSNRNNGFFSRDAQGTDFSRNIIYNSHNYGVYLLNSYYTNIFENSFINNSKQAYSDISLNNFTYQNIGNFWSDYHGNDGNSDGIGDENYKILGVNSLFDSKPKINLILEEVNPQEWLEIIVPDKVERNNAFTSGFIVFFGILGMVFLIVLQKKKNLLKK